MDITNIAELVSSGGISILFIVAVVYLYKAQEKKEQRQRLDQIEREARIVASLTVTENYIRDVLGRTVADNTAALHEISTTLKELPCRECIHHSDKI